MFSDHTGLPTANRSKFYHLDQIALAAIAAASPKSKKCIGHLTEELNSQCPMFQKLAAKQVCRFNEKYIIFYVTYSDHNNLVFLKLLT